MLSSSSGPAIARGLTTNTADDQSSRAACATAAGSRLLLPPAASRCCPPAAASTRLHALTHPTTLHCSCRQGGAPRHPPVLHCFHPLRRQLRRQHRECFLSLMLVVTAWNVLCGGCKLPCLLITCSWCANSGGFLLHFISCVSSPVQRSNGCTERSRAVCKLCLRRRAALRC